ncbi:MAG: DUF488 domain-containing protein [Phycisphaerales bacterium]|nr:DUF488 domain-containing protein [Phycisphaerales bacterium]
METGQSHPSYHDGQGNGSALLLTIGYGSKRTSEEFVDLLQRYGVKYLTDVRTKPFSRFRPEYSKDALAATLRRHGIAYIYMGDTLGGLPDDPTCYTDGKVDYCKVRDRVWFEQGLARLENGWHGGHRIAIMCAELEPNRCHRSKLIGEALVARGIAVGHIDEHGAVITHEAAMTRITGGQGVLFGADYTSRRTYRFGTDEEPN